MYNAIEIIGVEDWRIFKTFVEAVPLVGKRTLSIVASLEELIRTITVKKQAIDAGNEANNVKLLHSRLSITEGCIFEQDIYTEILIKLIEGLQQTSNKNIVLVVDDLDRIDAEHIFRILNVFAAHFDSRTITPN